MWDFDRLEGKERADAMWKFATMSTETDEELLERLRKADHWDKIPKEEDLREIDDVDEELLERLRKADLERLRKADLERKIPKEEDLREIDEASPTDEGSPFDESSPAVADLRRAQQALALDEMRRATDDFRRVQALDEMRRATNDLRRAQQALDEMRRATDDLRRLQTGAQVPPRGLNVFRAFRMRSTRSGDPSGRDRVRI